MSSASTLLPPIASAYAERAAERPSWIDRAVHHARGMLLRHARRTPQWGRLVAEIAEASRALDGVADAVLRRSAFELGERLRREGFQQELVTRVFALVREAADRTVGQRHYDVQMIGGAILLDGAVAEMETGEGKTLTATLAASAAALAGWPVHIITVNDYLAKRDAEWMGPIYRTLGLSVGLVVHGLAPEERRAAYACDVTYVTNKEIAFDYLRDRIILRGHPTRLQLQIERLGGSDARVRRLLLRGLVYAIVDEADSVLVDEARTPLIISGAGDDAPERKLYDTALEIGSALIPHQDFTMRDPDRVIALTNAGRDRVGELATPHGGLWTGRHRREELVRQALTALHLMERDKHYLVRDNRVQIIDEFTGRIMADRAWEQGLHQLVEVKEHCALTNRREPLARISYQRFFRRYLRLAGMTGTAAEVAGELWSVYRLPVIHVPTNRPLHRQGLMPTIYPTQDEKWAAIVRRIADVHTQGRPILVGTRSVGASEHLSLLLNRAHLPHVVLNARQDLDEAEIVAKAGERGRITVATNMAGRGTDILLAEGVADLGGLHVIATEYHEAGRIDRQLFGRCGRQGDPGTHEAFASLEDEIVRHARWANPLGPVPLRLRLAQRTAERLHSRVRRDLLRYDEHMETALAFSGRGE
jgi:preprotein translocase subunit SecA